MSFPKQPLELFTYLPSELTQQAWQGLLESAYCRYLSKKCNKTRKSQPEISIGTCTVGYGGSPIIICPYRFLQNRQIFLDAVPLLENHTAQNQLHVVPEVSIPGGSVDYFLVSVHQGQVKDYLALEMQALDTTGSVWFARQKMIRDEIGIPVELPIQEKSYGINWKMTAKTILIQMHHKVETLELLGKKLVLVIQDVFFDYMQKEFSTAGLKESQAGNSAHFHVYKLGSTFSLEIVVHYSTTATGIEQMLGRQKSAEIPEKILIERLQSKVSENTLLVE